MGRIQTALSSLSTAKTNIANAITAKGGTVNVGDGFADFATDIATIPSGGGASKLPQVADGTVTSITANDLQGVTKIRDYVFYKCEALTSVVIPNGVTEIGDHAFCACRTLTTITIPNSVTIIKMDSFLNCSALISITIPNSVTNIVNGAFYGCSELTNAIIGSGVTSIGSTVFRDCTSLSEIHFKATTPATVYHISAWMNVPTTCKIYVPRGYLSAYTTATNYPDPNTYTYIEED